MKTTSKFDDLNDTFNVTDDVVQPEVIEKKMLNIPVGWWLKRKDLKYITDVINDY